MVRERTHKRLKPGTLVCVNRLNEYGIVLSVKINWNLFVGEITDDPYWYNVLVRGEKVSETGGGLTVIGDS